MAKPFFRTLALVAAVAGLGLTAANVARADDSNSLNLSLVSPMQQLLLGMQIAHADAETLDGGVPCQGYTIVYINGVPVKVWYPAGCTPP